MKKRILTRIAPVLAMGMISYSCTEEVDTALYDESTNGSVAKDEVSFLSAKASAVYSSTPKVLDIDFVPLLNKFVIAVDMGERVGFYYGDDYDNRNPNDPQSWYRKNWNLASNLVMKDIETPFLGSAWDDAGNAIRIGKQDGERLFAVNGLINDGQPVFRGNTRAHKVGDLTEFIDIDYDASANIFIVNGLTESGEFKSYYTSGRFGATDSWKNWTEVKKYGSTKSEHVKMKGIAVDPERGAFIYIFNNNNPVLRQGQGRLYALLGFTRKGRPEFLPGGRGRIGDLVEFIDVDYNANDQYYAVTGVAIDGTLKTYISEPAKSNKFFRKWEEVKGRTVEKNTHGEYFGSAWAPRDGYFLTAFIADRNGLPSVTNGETNGGKPRFNPGRYTFGIDQ